MGTDHQWGGQADAAPDCTSPQKRVTTSCARGRRSSKTTRTENPKQRHKEEEEEEEETAAADLHMPRSTAHQKRWTRGACGHYANIGAKMGGPHHNDRLRTPRSRHRVEKLVLDGDAEADPSREDDERRNDGRQERERERGWGKATEEGKEASPPLAQGPKGRYVHAVRTAPAVGTRTTEQLAGASPSFAQRHGRKRPILHHQQHPEI
ncbi:unnamed protein product [Prorocentrum cordatum]|uniref:Uncharacterized protein n=1 Tax=Prorocentrum cordatum TaxID=2364126 RepID=A0ABN9S0U2_9DINO|nr:unnamed protein product [Polarella glacialis]